MKARAHNDGGGANRKGEKEGFINKMDFTAERVWRPCCVFFFFFKYSSESDEQT